MILPMKALAAVLTALLLLTLSANAQITYIPGTGCKNAINTPIGGQPKLGQNLSISAVQLPCNSPGTWAFVLLNFSCSRIPNLMFGCGGSSPCTMLLPADLSVFKPITANLNLSIPNDSKLVGAQFCVQGGCFTTFGGFCVFPLNTIAQIKIQA